MTDDDEDQPTHTGVMGQRLHARVERDDHPLAFLVDHVREAGMVQIQTEIAAALPDVSTALDRHGDSWWLHVAWGRRWARLYWHPEHGFDVFTDTFTESGLGPTATPADAIARLVEWVRGRLP